MNTQVSYRQDLDKMIEYFQLRQIFDYEMITVSNINSYITHLKLQGKSSATLLRNITVIKGYFDYLFKMHKIPECISDEIHRPEHTPTEKQKVSLEDGQAILEYVDGDAPKNKRDYLMVLLILENGIKISDLLSIKIQDINMEIGFIQCVIGQRVKTYALTKPTLMRLKEYLEEVRPRLIDAPEAEYLFCNMQGKQMSRQGAWKMIKYYAKKSNHLELNLSNLSTIASK